MFPSNVIKTIWLALFALLFFPLAISAQQSDSGARSSQRNGGDGQFLGETLNPFDFAYEGKAPTRTGVQKKTPAETSERRAEREPRPAEKPEKSEVESLFMRGPVPVGTALGGRARMEEKDEEDEDDKDKDRKDEDARWPDMRSRSEAQRPELRTGAERERDALLERERGELSEKDKRAAYFLLFQQGEEMTPIEKVRLYQLLDAKQKKRYLQSLAPREREQFLRALGEEARWYTDDLKPADIDRELKQFGYDFFDVGTDADEDGRFTPELFSPVGPDYVVGPGDTFKIDIWGSVSGSFEVTVDRSGEIVIPKVGAVHVWGQSFAEAKETIRKQVAKYYSNFEINISMGALRSIQVYLVGEVKNPGTYSLSSVASVLNGLAAAGGPTRTGSMRRVQLVRGGQSVSEVDFYDFFLAGDRSRDVRLQSGDTIHVPVSGSQVGVAGDVRRPAIYELKDTEDLGDVLRMAGWVNATAYLKKVQVERVQAHQARTVIDLDLAGLDARMDGVLDFTLQDRDLIKVAPIAQVASEYVWLRGYVAHPGPYELRPGMKLSDLLLPYDNLLPYYYPGVAEILRLQPPLYQPARETVDLEKALAGDPDHDLTLREHDEIRIFSRDEMEELAETSVAGAVLSPGDFRLYEGMRVRDLVVAAGNLKRSAYLEQAELSRLVPEGDKTTTRRMIIDLEKALAGDPGHNLLLEPHDSLFVRAIPDFAERLTVELEGEVKFPGTYSVSKGERLSSVISRAGGFTDNAYLRGAVFTREALEELQRERLEKLIRRQEQEVFRTSAAIAQGALSTEELQAAESVLQARQNLVDKLRELPVTGRMVVNLAPVDDLRGSEYDVELMSGDTISVPENPQSVTVLGQVYNPVSLTFRPGKTVAYYLNKVGGANEDANTDEMFIVRADGTVYSKQQAGMGVRWDSENFRWVFGGFNNTPLYPGDTVLVPEKFARLNVMREVKDLTQIFYQMALGAAAIASF